MLSYTFLITLGFIVCVSCQTTPNNTYSCHTGDDCKGHTSNFGLINNVLYCCNPGDGMSIGSGITVANGVFIGKRNIIINHMDNLQCVCTVTDPADAAKLSQVSSQVNDILHSVSESLGELGTSIENTLNNLDTLLGNL